MRSQVLRSQGRREKYNNLWSRIWKGRSMISGFMYTCRETIGSSASGQTSGCVISRALPAGLLTLEFFNRTVQRRYMYSAHLVI